VIDRLRAFWARIKWPLVWATVPLLLYIVGGKAYTVYVEHQTMVRWINAVDKQLAPLLKAQPATSTSTTGP